MNDLSTDSNSKNIRSGLLKKVALGAITAALLTIPAFADTIGGAEVTTNDSALNFRTEPSTDSAVLEMIPNGTFLLVEEQLEGWYKVAYDGQVGYVSADYVSFSQKLDGIYDFDAATSASMVNIRYSGSLSSPVLGTFPTSGTKLKVTGVDGNWLHISNAYGSGYIRSDLVKYKLDVEEGAAAAQSQSASTASAYSASTASVSVSSGSSVGAQVAATAQQYVGYRYTWGGISPDTGFDCSGFVNYIYKLYGYSMERVAQNIYSSSGTFVSKDQLQPGDILCFGYGAYSVGHVGIYIGNGQMVHASNTRTGVIITDISSTYYTNTYVGAKRIVSA